MPTFSDIGMLSEYAKEAVEAFCKAGIISGKGAGLLDPKGQATRAECAAMLTKLF